MIGYPKWSTYRKIGNTDATAPDNGYIYVCYFAPTENWVEVKINGVTVSHGGWGQGGGNWSFSYL